MKLAKRSEALAYVAETSRALAEVGDDALGTKHLLDKTATAQDLARRINLDQEARDELARLQFRIRRQLGEILAREVTPRSGTHGLPAGVSKKLSSTSQQIATIPSPKFENFLARGKELTLKRLLRIARELAEPDDDEDPPPVETIGQAKTLHGDFREILADLSDVDAIITDPPYPEEFIDLFEDLGELAATILKPDGFVLAMVGQSHLPTYIERLSRNLTYRWTAAYLVNGPANRVHHRKVGAKWKPLLIFDRAGDRRFITQDVFSSEGDDKRHHHWGQSESGVADILERVTKPGELVVDPFMGGGTTAVACEALGRRFVGCDIEAAAVRTTRERLAA